MKTKMNIQVKTAILAIVACLARGVWLLAALAAFASPLAALADASLEETGGFLTTTPTLAFKNARVIDLNANTMSARMNGAWISAGIKGCKVVFCNFNYANDYSSMTCEAQITDGSYVKGAVLSFTASGDDILASVTGVGNASTTSFSVGQGSIAGKNEAGGTAPSIAISATSTGYGVYGLRLPKVTDNRATVTWETGEFKTVKIGTDGNTYSISLNDNTVNGANNILIGDTTTLGVTISLANVTANLKNVAVLVKYTAPTGTGVPRANPVIAAVKESYDIGAICTTAEGGTVTGYYYDNGIKNNSGSYWALGNAPIARGSTGYFGFSHQCGGRGTVMFSGTDRASLTGGQSAGLKWDGGTITSIAIGGPNVAGANPWAGLVIEKIALFVDTSTGNGSGPFAAYQWPSEYTTQDYANWNYAPDIFTWNAGNADIGSSADNAATLFLRGTGTDSTKQVGRGGNTDYNGSTFWHNFCCNQSAYKAPGLTLRINTGSKIQAGFSALGTTPQGAFTLGGLIVESTGENCELQGNDTTNGRATILGSADGSETWFGIKANAFVKRTGYLVLSGIVNIDVAENKVFNLNEGGTEAAIYGKDEYAPVVKARITNTATGEGAIGGTLKMHGAGQVKATTLTATGSTLDYSDLAAARATPFVSGALAVDGDTVFKFPASAAFPYPVATSVSSTASGDVTFFVGSDSFTRELVFTDGNAYPERRATFAGGETAINWSSLVWDISYADETRAFSRVTASASGTLALGTVSTGKVILEVPQGVELTLTGTLAASEIVVTGAGTVICSAANTLQGTVTGDATVTVVYSALPTTGTGGATFTDTGWQGVLWLKNATVNNFNARNLGSANSVLRFTGCTGYAYALSGESSYECSCTIDLQDDGETKALTLSNGYGGWRAIYKALTGTGTLYSNTATRHYYIFKDSSAFAGSISLDTAALTHIVLGDATATDTTDGSVYVASGATATVATGKTWTAPSGFDVNGTLAVAGTGLVSGDVTASSGATLDLAAYTGSQAVSGELTPSAGSTLLLPSGATLPYQVATSGDAMLAHFTYQIGDNAAVTGPVLFDDGALLADGVKTATLEGMNGTAIDTLFGNGAITWAGSGNHYVLTLTAANSFLTVGDTTGVESLTIIVQNDGALFVSGELPENMVVEGLGALTVAENATAEFYTDYTRLYSQIGEATTGNGAISTSGTTISAGGALAPSAPVAAGNYTLARWLSPQKLSTGYGYAASVSIASPATVASGCAYELVYMADRIVLRVYDTAAQNARGTLKIWPYGDSITEGFNGGGTKANYRVLLAQKLTLLGYNVEMVGCYGQINQANGVDPSGQVIPDAWKWHSAKHGGTAGPTSATGRNNLQENVDTLAAQAGSPDVVLLHIGVNDLAASGQTPASTFTAWTNVVDRLSTDLPDSKIVATTLIYGDVSYSTRASQAPNITTFNGLVREFMTNSKPAAWTNVIFLDMETKVGTYADKAADDGITYNTGDDWLHPDWWGHDQMAEAWLSVIESNFTPSGTFNASAAAAVDSSELGAAAKTELADYRKGFKRYGWFEATGAKDIENITYNDIDASAATENIGRVGYFVEYVRADNNAHKWVWVDMDAFGTTIAELGLPAANHQQIVKHLHVKSNHNGIEDVAADDDSVSGWVEFSPNDYAGTVSGIRCSPSGNASVYDWNDKLSEEANVDSGTNACMQVFRMAPGVPSGRGAQTLFAYNNWRSSTLGAEFGIGNFSSHYYGGANEAQTIDYTKTRSAVKMNAEAYTVKRIEIWTNPNKVGITTDGQGSNQNNSTYANSVNWSLNISQASPLTANDTKVKVDSISIGMRPDVSLAVMRLVVKDATSGDVLGTSELANGTGTTSGKAYANGAIRQEYKFAQDLLLDVGTTYTLEMVDSSGAKVGQGLRLETTTTAPIYNDHGDNTTYRITQDLCLSRVHVASVAADVASFGALTFSPALPTDYSDSALLVNVTADATVTLGAATTVGSIRFAVAEGVTLTIADPANINAGEVVFYGPGRVAFTGAPNFGAADVEFAGSPTVALALGQTIATTGDVVIDKNASVTFEPATITDPTAALVAAASLVNNGTIAVTAPDQGSDYSVAATATGVVLRRVTKEAFSYDAYPDGTGPTGWFESWGGEQLSTTSLRVGPSDAIPFVYHTSGSAHPWNALAARTSGVSLAVYADVSEMNSSKGVIAQFGNKDSGIFMYRDGDYVKVAKIVKSSITTSKWVPGVEVQSGFHLYTFTYDPATGAAALYLDDGSVSAATDGSADYAHLGTTVLNDGFQIGATYQNNPSGFANGADMALCSVRGYDAVLAPQEVATLSESFPATDGTIDRHIVLGDSSNTQTLSVYSSTQKTGVSAILATNGGNIVIPAGEEVTVDRFRTFTDGTSKAANALTVNGTLNIANVDSTPDATCGIVLGWWLRPTDGARTSVVTVPAGGEIDASNAYFVIPYVNNMASATLNVSGGTVKTKGLYAYHPNSNSVLGHITISGGGVLELGEQVTAGKVIEKSFGYGTYRVKGTGEEKGSIAFTSTATAQPTTLDPYGCTLTLSGMSGAGYITVADSSAGDGTVVFPAQGSFTGAIILTDDNAANIDIGQYTGKIVLRGTAAETIDKLDGYTGIVIIDQAGTYDFRSIDLSAATVQIAHANAVVNATAGKEGNVSVVVGTCNLYTDNNTFLYDGHVFAGGVNSVGATLNYIHSEAYSSGSLSWEANAAFSAEELAEVKSGNNIAPYFKIFTGHADGDDMSGSLATATDWNGHTAEDAAPTSGNMAIRVADGKTFTVEVPSAVTFGEVQVFGSGAVVFTGEAALTVAKGMYVTPGTTVEINPSNVAFSGDGNPGVHVDYGLTEATSGGVVLAGGTAESPYAPYIYGQGAVVVPEGAVASLANQQNAISYLTVDGTATAAESSTALAALSSLTVSATGELSVPADATVSPATLTVNGTMNMASTATLSGVTTLSGTGTVVWNGKNVDLTLWSSQTGWTGTNAVYNLTGNANRAVQSWGRNGSYVLLSGVKGHLDPNIVIQAEVLLDNGTSGYGIEVSDGSGNDNPTYFRKLSGTGTFKQSGTTGNQRFVLRDVSDFTGSIERTDTQRVMIIDGTTVQANLPGRSANAGNMFFANIVAKIGDGNSWSVSSDKSISIAGTATVELLGAASITGATTIGGGATLTFDDIGTSETPKKLTLSSTVTVASANTVNIALSAEAAAALYDGAVLIDWTAAGAAPEGSFAFSDSTLADDWVLFKAADGLVVYDKTIDDTSSNPAAVLNVDDSGALVATVTPTGNAITLPAVISKMTVSVSASQLANITASGVAVGDVVVKYGDTVTTGAYSITKSGDVISFDINTTADASVTIADETIKVRPETAASTPMTMSAGAPSFTLKTIPGLWYRAAVCASPDGTFASCGTAVQATSTSTTVNGTAEWGSGEKVRYYRIKAGAASDL